WHYPAQALPEFADRGMSGRLIAGRLAGVESPVKVDSPQFYVHWQLSAGARASLPAEYPERAVYVASGEVEIGGQRVEAGSMAVLVPGDAVTILAVGDAVLMALGGEPVGPRYIDWNFVSSSKERIDQARADWAAGRMKLPDLDDGEFIPLPPKIAGVREPGPISRAAGARRLRPTRSTSIRRHDLDLRHPDRFPGHVRLRDQRRAGGGAPPPGPVRRSGAVLRRGHRRRHHPRRAAGRGPRFGGGLALPGGVGGGRA